MSRAFLFDRDNTLTKDAGYTHKVEDLVFMPGAVEAIKLSQAAGVKVIVVSNQAGVAKGKFSLDDMLAFNKAVDEQLVAQGAKPVDAWYCCPYHEEGVVAQYALANHPERKPNPGMVRRALLEQCLGEYVVMFGDQQHDVEAAQRAGVRGILCNEPGKLLDAVKACLNELSSPKAGLQDASSRAAEALRDRAQKARSWLFETALPLWWNVGYDKATSCFHERIGLDGKAVATLPRRGRVQARQTFVYAAAGRLGWTGPWKEAVLAGVDVLTKKCMSSEGAPVLTLGPDGNIADGRSDLYDAAFLIFALAHASMALRDQAVAAKGEMVFAWVKKNWSHPQGGFREGDVVTPLPRRQNPHMHMLEAMLAMYEATGKEQYAEEARTIVGLFESKFATRGALLEYFDDNWHAAAGDEGRVTEPGHQFEWCWLLHQAKNRTGRDATALARAVRVHGEVYGVTEGQVVLDEVWVEGLPKTPTSRLWPYTERIKAGLAVYEAGRQYRDAESAVAAFDGLMGYCSGLPVAGTWRDRRKTDGSFVEEASPASSFYHIVVAMSELIRVADLK